MPISANGSMSTHLEKYDIYNLDGDIIKRDFEAKSPLLAAKHYLGTLCYEVVAIGRGARNPWDGIWNHPHFTDNPPTWHFGSRKIGTVRDPKPVGMVRLSSSRQEFANSD